MKTKLKYHTITVRLSASEFELLERAVNLSKMSKSAIVTSFINESLPLLITVLEQNQNNVNKVMNNVTNSISKRN
jgi:hypothetical protein